jgi:hypothetical protein
MGSSIPGFDMIDSSRSSKLSLSKYAEWIPKMYLFLMIHKKEKLA